MPTTNPRPNRPQAVPRLGQPPPPRVAAAAPFQRSVIRESRAIWGLDAPIPVIGAQFQQESGWRPTICSPYACGLAQFTPSTAAWISRAYPGSLAGADVFNPAWAIRALVRYDRHLFDRVPPAATECDQWAFTLSAYNGGLGWVARDAALCDAAAGCDGRRWFRNVELHSKRSKAAMRENRGYPRRILFNQEPYTMWGRSITCN